MLTTHTHLTGECRMRQLDEEGFFIHISIVLVCASTQLGLQPASRLWLTVLRSRATAWDGQTTKTLPLCLSSAATLVRVCDPDMHMVTQPTRQRVGMVAANHSLACSVHLQCASHTSSSSREYGPYCWLTFSHMLGVMVYPILQGHDCGVQLPKQLLSASSGGCRRPLSLRRRVCVGAAQLSKLLLPPA
jgi:hypothetical protein